MEGREGTYSAAVYTILELIENENGNRSISAHDFIHEQGKDF